VTQLTSPSTSVTGLAQFGTSASPSIPLRPERILLGWLDEQTAQTVLADPGSTELLDTQLVPYQMAVAAVAARPNGVDQTTVFRGGPPAEVQTHIEALRVAGTAAVFFNEGWSVQMIDLTNVISLQPNVVIENATARATGLEPEDLAGIASVTLPIEAPLPLAVGYDPVRKNWNCVSTNHNLQVLAPMNKKDDQLGPGGVGFAIGVPPSFMQVALFDGRFILRDGYHRAYGLLRSGISVVPSFVREFPSVDGLLLNGLMPAALFLGAKPPVLADFFDDAVSTTRLRPTLRKVVSIQASELMIAG
jgi:hypothetical protein